MGEVAVVTGGAGGIGLAAAKIVGRERTVVICDISQDRLNAAVTELQELGIERRPSSVISPIRAPSRNWSRSQLRSVRSPR